MSKNPADGKLTQKIKELTIEIDKLKRSEKVLRENEKRFRQVYEHMSVGVARISLKFCIENANAAYCHMLGYSEKELIGKHLSDITHPEIVAENLRQQLHLATGKIDHYRMEKCFIHKSGHVVHGILDANLIRGVDGKPLYFLGSVLDITEQKQVEQALRESQGKLNAMLASLTDQATMIDRDLNIIWANDTAKRLFGENLIGKKCYQVYHHRETPCAPYPCLTLKTFKDGQLHSHETQIVGKDKQTRYFHCTSNVALRDKNGNPTAVMEICRDITEGKKAEKEKKKLEAQLIQSQKMEAIGTLAGGIAHDFNNILTSIIGNADLALMDLGKNTRGYIEQILKSGKSAASLTHQLLTFSRKELIRPRRLNLNRVTMNSEKMLCRLIGEDIKLVTVYAPDPWQVEADPGQIEQVIMNLSINARDAMPTGGMLTIETENVYLNKEYFQDHAVENETGPHVMLAVTDNGTGMDKKTQARIFEPFFTTKKMGRGTGLGLSTVFGIVKQNKGYIWVYSEEKKGTTFKVYLPKAGADIKGVENKQYSGCELKGVETILVAEDDETLRILTGEMLKGYGFRILTGRDGKDAIKISDSHKGPIHLLLTDVVMPDMSGRDLADRLQVTIPDIKILYMSGYTANIIAHHGVLEKGVAFIQKPFTREGLAGKIRKVLDRQQD